MSEEFPRIFFASPLDANDASQDDKPVAQCDCACSDDQFAFSIAAGGTAHPLGQSPTLHIQPLPNDHCLMFNPYHTEGVVVLNRAARRLWDGYGGANDCAPLLDAPLVETMLRAGLLQPVGATVTPRRGAPQTLTAWLHVTNECNLRCDYCYVAKTAEDMTPATGVAAVDAIVRSAARGGFRAIHLKFAGGEATLNLGLVYALHSYATEQAATAGLEMRAAVLSNGVAVGRREIAELKRRDIGVMISLDGVSAAHDAQRHFANGRGSFAHVDRAIDRLIEQGLPPFISITITDRNLDALPDVVSYVLARGLAFNLNFFRDNDCAAPFDDLRLQDDRLIAALHRAFDVIEENLPPYSLLQSLVDRSSFNRPHDKTCGVGESYMVIDHRGRVAKCHMQMEKTITDVMADDPLAVLQADTIGLQNVSVTTKQGCRECEWRFWCAGGCPLQTYRDTGRYDVQSPYCRVYKALYPRLLRLEGLRLLQAQL